MYKRIEPAQFLETFETFPHCDARILHAPGECKYCDMKPDWQMLRQSWSIAFTGYTPEGKELPCPADYARGDAHKNWIGNVARPQETQNDGKNGSVQSQG